MSEIKYKIGAYNPDTRRVPVSFTAGAITHKREVNAVLGEAGDYDRAATKARVEDVALGVAHKILVGAIGATRPEILPDTTSD